MLEYELERLPQSMQQGPKMLITLRPPSSEHWNIETDLMLTMTMETYKQQREAKRAEQDPEQEFAGTKASPKDAGSGRGSSGHGRWQQSCVPNRDHMPGRKRFGDCTGCCRAHSCPLPPDNTRDGKCEGGRASSCPHPYGRVCQITIYPVRRPHQEFISSTLGAGGLQRGPVG